MELYITPASIGYLNQLILCLMIGCYLLVLQSHRRQPINRILGYYFFVITGLLFTFFFESALAPSQRIYPLFLQTPLISLGLILIFQFAYRFPHLAETRRREARLVLLLSGLYALWEWGYALYRAITLVGHQQFIYRPGWNNYLLLLLILLLPMAFLRQLLVLTPQREPGWAGVVAMIIHPPNMIVRATRNNMIIACFLIVTDVSYILRHHYIISDTLSNIVISVGGLFVLFFFALNYLNAQPETTSFMIKLAGITCTTMLAILGCVGWVIAPPNAVNNPVMLPNQQTLRFSPKIDSGYEIVAQPVTDIELLGTKIFLSESPAHECSHPLNFSFPFYGKRYDHVFVCNDGTVSMGQAVAYRNYQYYYGGGTPVIMALLTNLDADAGQGGVFVYQDPERMVITWYDLPNYHEPEQVFTFQAILYKDGCFDLTYHAVPPLLTYYPNNNPGASAWVIGALPGSEGRRTPQPINVATLPISIGPEGAIHDYLLDYRSQLHHLLIPLVWLILATSIFIVGIFPWFFQRTLVHPLNTLLAGVRRMMGGDYSTNLPVRYEDEIGFLTSAFNQLSADQGRLIQTLESQVAERTTKLDVINVQLQAEMSENQKAQAQILQHQRMLATLAERERLGRDLHDSLGQMFAVINMQVQTAQVLLQRNETTAANHALEKVGVAARQAHADVRGFILGLRGTPTRSFWMALQQSIENIRSYGITVQMEEDEPWDAHWLSPINEINLLRIIQEALSNVRQHAYATLVRIRFERHHDRLKLHIHDNGIGLTLPPSSDSTQHFGLKTMQERANELRGVLYICSDAHHGTEISLEIPINTYANASHVS
ncbi:sensor histidine kinase [Candidatus Oscillochloris fontis]|uniref:sensor histidine kinase n=1 Tax=Candidatus Oscillochloris fontis TaxID=2496868 RepID=UPI00101D8F23|nr:sensor histidine kinase [Candidatus Oscillochloris fontis]